MHRRARQRVVARHTEAWDVKIDTPLVLAEHIRQVKLVFQGQEGRVVVKSGQADGCGHV
jgi:hypothetical protein